MDEIFGDSSRFHVDLASKQNGNASTFGTSFYILAGLNLVALYFREKVEICAETSWKFAELVCVCFGKLLNLCFLLQSGLNLYRILGFCCHWHHHDSA